MKCLSINPILRVCVVKNDVFFQERKNTIDKNWRVTNIPKFYFSDDSNKCKKDFLSTKEILSRIEGTELYKEFYDSEKNIEYNYVDKNIIHLMQDFIDENIPWVNNITINDGLIDGYAREVYGINCPDNIAPLVKLVLACNTPLLELGVAESSFDDGFYYTTSIVPIRSILASKDLKTAIKRLIGLYNKTISLEIKNALYGDINAIYKLSLLSFFHGMKQENILKVLSKGELLSDKVFNKFQFNSYKIDNEGFAILPNWVSQAPEKYRIEWMLDDFEMLVECILLTSQETNTNMFNDIDFNTKNIYLIHNRIVDVINYHFVLDNVALENNKSPIDTSDIGNIGGIEYSVLDNALDLACVGKKMNVCVGSEPYYKRLSSGSSVFLHGIVNDDKNSSILVEIDVKTGKIIEARGDNNSDISVNNMEKTLLAAGHVFSEGVSDC